MRPPTKLAIKIIEVEISHAKKPGLSFGLINISKVKSSGKQANIKLPSRSILLIFIVANKLQARDKGEIFNNVAIGIFTPKNIEPSSPEKPAPNKKTIFIKAVMINKIIAKIVVQSLFTGNLLVVIVFNNELHY
jgi:hypothetical protein